jgi:predicted HicB family RNase H-like nuclease
MLEYKGYRGAVEYIDESKIFHGEVLGTKDVITFRGTSVDEIEKAFRESIDDYLDFCAEEGVEPDKPYSGKFNVRIPETVHRQIAEMAKIENESLNDIVLRSLQEYLDKEKGRPHSIEKNPRSKSPHKTHA